MVVDELNNLKYEWDYLKKQAKEKAATIQKVKGNSMQRLENMMKTRGYISKNNTLRPVRPVRLTPGTSEC